MSFFRAKANTTLKAPESLTTHSRVNALGQGESSLALLERQLHRLTQLLRNYQQQPWALERSGEEAFVWIQRVLRAVNEAQRPCLSSEEVSAPQLKPRFVPPKLRR